MLVATIIEGRGTPETGTSVSSPDGGYVSFTHSTRQGTLPRITSTFLISQSILLPCPISLEASLGTKKSEKTRQISFVMDEGRCQLTCEQSDTCVIQELCGEYIAVRLVHLLGPEIEGAVKSILRSVAKVSRHSGLNSRSDGEMATLIGIDNSGRVELRSRCEIRMTLTETDLAKTLREEVSARALTIRIPEHAHLGESKYGMHMLSILPSRLITAAVFRLPIRAWS